MLILFLLWEVTSMHALCSCFGDTFLQTVCQHEEHKDPVQHAMVAQEAPLLIAIAIAYKGANSQCVNQILGFVWFKVHGIVAIHSRSSHCDAQGPLCATDATPIHMV